MQLAANRASALRYHQSNKGNPTTQIVTAFGGIQDCTGFQCPMEANDKICKCVFFMKYLSFD